MTSDLHKPGLAAFSVCQNALLKEGMQSDLDIVVEAGIGAVGLLGSVVERTGLSTTVGLLAERNLTVSSYTSVARILELSFDECVDALVAGIQAAATLGSPIMTMVTGSPGSLTTEEADNEIVARLQKVSPQARDQGVLLALEPVHPFLRTVSYVHSLMHSLDIVRQVPGGAIVLDVAHVYWNRHVYEEIAMSTPYICLAQLSNLSPASIKERRWIRGALDQGVIPVEAMIRALAEAGFTGFYEDEILDFTGRQECLTGLVRAKEWFASLSSSASAWT